MSLKILYQVILTPLKQLTVRTIIPFKNYLGILPVEGKKKTRISCVTLRLQDFNNQKLANKKLILKDPRKTVGGFMYMYLFLSFSAHFSDLFLY